MAYRMNSSNTAKLKKEVVALITEHSYRIPKTAVSLGIKKRKKIQRPRLLTEIPTKSNQRWSMDFVSDQLANGKNALEY